VLCNDRFGTFVLRSLLYILRGKQPPPKQKEAGGGGIDNRESQNSESTFEAPSSFTYLFESINNSFLQQNLYDYITETKSSPVIQILLELSNDVESFMSKGFHLTLSDYIKPNSDFNWLFKHRVGSHFIQKLFKVLFN
jgi:hypothetical protein